jgi:hypothetical protein
MATALLALQSLWQRAATCLACSLCLVYTMQQAISNLPRLLSDDDIFRYEPPSSAAEDENGDAVRAGSPR